MVGYAGSPTYTAYVDMTLTQSKVKVKATGLLNFRQLAKPCMLAAMTAAPLWGFLVFVLYYTVSQYGGDACNTTEENSRIFSVIQMRWLPSARACGQ